MGVRREFGDLERGQRSEQQAGRRLLREKQGAYVYVYVYYNIKTE